MFSEEWHLMQVVGPTFIFDEWYCFSCQIFCLSLGLSVTFQKETNDGFACLVNCSRARPDSPFNSTWQTSLLIYTGAFWHCCDSTGNMKLYTFKGGYLKLGTLNPCLDTFWDISYLVSRAGEHLSVVPATGAPLTHLRWVGRVLSSETLPTASSSYKCELGIYPGPATMCVCMFHAHSIWISSNAKVFREQLQFKCRCKLWQTQMG